jgi:uncharacterized spore protein YtfJ
MTIVAKEILDNILGHVEHLASTKTIIGEPVTIADKTIIPVMKVTLGFGAGGIDGSGQGKGDNAISGSGTGGGGGGGICITPAGFIFIEGDKISLHGTKPKMFETIFDSVPEIIEKIGEMKGKKEAKKEEKKEEKS